MTHLYTLTSKSLAWAKSLLTTAPDEWRAYQWQEACGLPWCGELETLSWVVSMLFVCLHARACLQAHTCVRGHVPTHRVCLLNLSWHSKPPPCHSPPRLALAVTARWDTARRLLFHTALYWADENPLFFNPFSSLIGLWLLDDFRG